MRTSATAWLAMTTTLGLAVGCGSDDDPGDGRGLEHAGSVCESPADCYPEIDAGVLSGEVRCLDRVRAGYCTHLCDTDDDCCAIEGECETDLRQVCAPFESTGERVCFLSCEPEDLEGYPGADPEDPIHEQEYCQREAGWDFICRSSGGGAENRKVCVPGDCDVGAGCADEVDCAGDLECLEAFDGGYCSVRDCGSDADCPEGSACVDRDGGFNYCARICEHETDCSFCRRRRFAGTCTPDATLVEPASVSVCIPPGG